MLRRQAQMMLALNIDNNLGHEIMEHVHKTWNALMLQKRRTA